MHRRRPGATPNRDLPRLDRQISEPPPLANLNVKISIGELCDVAEVRLPSFVTHKRRSTATRCAPAIMPLGGATPESGINLNLTTNAGRERQYGADDKSAIAIRHSTVPSCWSGS